MKNIIIDCERMKHKHTGLYSFCKQLSTGLLQIKKADEHLNFFVPESEIGFLGNEVGYKKQTSLQKFYLPGTSKYDLWHCTYQTSNYYPPKNKTKVVITIHDLNFLHEGKTKAKEEKYLNNVQQKIKRADFIVANSNFVRKEVEHYLDLYNKPVTTIYSGSVALQNVQDKKPDFIGDAPFLFSVGTIARKKNFHVLPALLIKNDLILVIAGINQDEAYRQEILAAAKKLGVQDRVILPGAVSEEEKYWMLKNCRLFCFPSIAEGFGLPVIEAMNYGRPCILSNYTSLPEVGGPLGFYLKSFDENYMANFANDVLKETSLHDKTNEIIKWASQFNWQKTADEYFEVYRKVLG